MPTRARRILTAVRLLGLPWCPLRGWADERPHQCIVLFEICEQPCSEWTSAVTEHKNTPFGSMTVPAMAGYTTRRTARREKCVCAGGAIPGQQSRQQERCAIYSHVEGGDSRG
jgi:hypothetical protein